MFLFESLIASALLGGGLVGLALGGLTLLTGRVMSGASMVGSLLGGAEGVAATSITFIGGLVAAALVIGGLGAVPAPETHLALIVAGGGLVGAGARFSGASLGGALTALARGRTDALTILVILLVGATLGGIVQVIVAGGSGA